MYLVKTWVSTTAQVLIYPTIVENRVNVSVKKNSDDIQTMNVTVMDENGRTVLQQQKINFQSHQISLPHLSFGVYIILIEYGANSYEQKIIVSR